MPPVRLITAFALVVALGVPTFANADAIDPDAPPLECDDLPCPRGSNGAALSHSSCPSVCAPNLECGTDAECQSSYGQGATCEPTRFCVERRYSGPGSSLAVLDACLPTGPCGSAPPAGDGDAPRCEELSRCVPGPEAATEAAGPDDTARGGCAGCATSRGRGSLGWLALVAFGALALRSTRSR